MHALGSLDARERELFEQHLHECEDCAGDVLSLSKVADLIGESVSAVPPERLGKRLLSRIGVSPRVPGIVMEQSGILIARSAELAWQPLATGIYQKPLFEDRDRRYNTSLIRMDAGAHYPSHEHAAMRSCFFFPAIFTSKDKSCVRATIAGLIAGRSMMNPSPTAGVCSY